MSEAELPTTNMRKCFACIKRWPQNAAICIDAIELFCSRSAKELMRDSKLPFQNAFSDNDNPCQYFCSGQPHQKTGYEPLHL